MLRGLGHLRPVTVRCAFTNIIANLLQLSIRCFCCCLFGCMLPKCFDQSSILLVVWQSGEEPPEKTNYFIGMLAHYYLECQQCARSFWQALGRHD